MKLIKLVNLLSSRVPVRFGRFIRYMFAWQAYIVGLEDYMIISYISIINLQKKKAGESFRLFNLFQTRDYDRYDGRGDGDVHGH